MVSKVHRARSSMLGPLGLAVSLACTVPGTAQAEGCALNGMVLTCGESRPAIAAALAHPDTPDLFETLVADRDFWLDAAARETFRKSLERVHRATRLDARAAFRRYRDHQLTAAQYEAVRTQYEAAVGNYRAGILAYHEGEWKDPRGAERD